MNALIDAKLHNDGIDKPWETQKEKRYQEEKWE
jgi:hypothetical protein